MSLSRKLSLMGRTDKLGSQLKRLIQVRTQSHWEGGKRKGRVKSSSLWRVGVDNPSIFKQRTRVMVNQSCCISTLFDQSGSMVGDKHHHAAACAGMLAKAYASLRIPSEILGFSDQFYEKKLPLHFVYKSWDTYPKGEDVVKMFQDVEDAGLLQNNADGEALMWAYRRMQHRPEKKKVLIVLSDGSPASSTDGSDWDYLHHVIKVLEKKGVILHGVGLLDESVREFYKSHYVVYNASDMEALFVNLLKKEILL